MNNTFICIKGVSASGKSTRVLQLIKFLREVKNYNFEDIFYENKKIGFNIKEINTIYIGNFYCSGGIERLQGFDTKTGIFKTADNASMHFKDLLKNYNVIIEGAGITSSYRYRPFFIFQYLEASNILLQYYNFLKNDVNDYYERIIYRSGKKPNKNTMWSKNIHFIKEYTDSLFEKEQIFKAGFQGKIEIYNNDYKEPIYDFGRKFFEFFDKKECAAEFIDWSIKNDYSKVNAYINQIKEFENQKEIDKKIESKIELKRVLF